jgi:hypothetical protein
MLNLDLVMLKFDAWHLAGYWHTGIRGAYSGVSIESLIGIVVAYKPQMG